MRFEVEPDLACHPSTKKAEAGALPPVPGQIGCIEKPWLKNNLEN